MKHKYPIILFVTLFSTISCKQEYVTETQSITSTVKNVRAVALQSMLQTDPIMATGTLLSKEEVVLSFKIGGIVNRLNVNEGESVNKNEQLGSLNLSEINAQVVSATNAYDKSVRDLERAINLYRDTVGTLEQQQNTKTAKEIANSNLEIARFNRRFSVINTPIKGKVLTRYVEAGQLVSAGQPIYKIGSSGTKGSQIIRLGLADKDIVKTALKDSATIRFDAFAKSEYKAIVTGISQAANPRTGLFEVELSLDEYRPELMNGFIGIVGITPSLSSSTYKIPMNALVEGKQNKASIFYTEDDSTVKYLEVEVLNFVEDFFTVAADALPKQIKVITEGAPYLAKNDSINIAQ